jgi:hypothetical protein
MHTPTNRKRGGQPGNRNAVGNQNAVKDGWHTAAAKDARWAYWQALQAAYLANKSAASTESASASRSMLSIDTLRSPRSTEPT